MCASLCGVALISLVCAGCASKYGRLIPAKEMAMYNAESRIRLLEHYDKENKTNFNESEIAALKQQVAALKKAIEEDKKKPKG